MRKLLDEPVHVWSCGVDDPHLELGAFTTREERANAETFGSSQAGHEYLCRRALLRVVVSGTVGCRPDECELSSSGERRLVVTRPEGVYSSVGSSAGQVIAAVGLCGPVGVDIEAVDLGFDRSLVLLDHFTDEERRLLTGLPPGAFFQAWCCKEACAKALGVGLARPLVAYDVTPVLSSDAGVARVWTPEGPSLDCLVLPALDGYRSACAWVSQSDQVIES